MSVSTSLTQEIIVELIILLPKKFLINLSSKLGIVIVLTIFSYQIWQV